MAENHDPIIADGETPEVAEETEGRARRAARSRTAGSTRPWATPTSEWWPNRLNLKILAKNAPATDPYHGELDYREAFKTLDLAAVKADIAAVLTDSKDWWPADFGSYAGLFVRMAWHAAGTYRLADGRGGAGAGQQRFAPLNSWPDNVNLDKSRRLLWPVKKKYGKKLSWADLIVPGGQRGHGGGRLRDLRLRRRPGGRLRARRRRVLGRGDRVARDRPLAATDKLEEPLGADTMGLIYVNPEGPNASGDFLAAARHIRETFGRMAMNDEETVALIAGGHTFGKTHGAGAAENVGPDPEAAPLEEQGFGWKTDYGTGVGADAITSGIEVTWTYHPTRWDNEYFHILFGYEWEQFTSAAGAKQWRPKDGGGAGLVPEAFGDGKREPRMLTTDLSLRFDPIYEPISRRFKDDQAAFSDAYARAWFKLTHRDMGPKVRYLGPEVPAEELIWQDPVPAVDHELVSADDVAGLKREILASGLTVAQLVSTALGVGLDVPRQRQARRRQRRPDPARPAERLGGQPARPARLGAAHPGGHPVLVQQQRDGRQEDLPGRPDRAGGQRRRGEGGRGRGRHRRGAVHPGPDRRERRADRRRVVQLPGAEGGRVPQLPDQGAAAPGRVPPDRPGQPADAVRAGDDRPGRRPAGARGELGRVQASACSPRRRAC